MKMLVIKIKLSIVRAPFCLMSADAVNLLRTEGFEALQMRDGVAE